MRFDGPTVTIGVLALLAALALAKWGGMQWPRLIVILVMTAVAGLLQGTFGPKLRQGVNWVDHTVSHTVNQYTGAAVTGIVATAVCVFLAFRLWKNTIDFKTLAAAAAAPVAAGLVPGGFGVAFSALVGLLAVAGAFLIRILF